MHLRTRVLLLTTAFALTLLAITFGLSWRARVAQERWNSVVALETQANITLTEIIRVHHALRKRTESYGIVLQLLNSPSLSKTDTSLLRQKMLAFQRTHSEIASRQVVTEAQRLIDAGKYDLAQQLPALKRQTRDMMLAGLAIAWILVICSFAAVQITLRKVVRPLEDLVRAADRIAEGDLNARAPVGGDLEIAKLGTAFNHMADKLRAHARTDDLTGLPNFRAFRERIDAEIERAARYPEHFGILVLDLDHFKQYNDRHGHLAGNDALQRVARALRIAVRTVDFPARYGGEEFAVILPQVETATLTTVAERVRATVESLPALSGGGAVTISVGGALYPTDGTTVDALFHLADERLYQAKRDGRNRVVIAAPVRRSADRQSA